MLPARSTTLNAMVLAPLFNVAPFQLMAVLLPALVTLAVMSVHVAPPSTEPNKLSPALKAPDKVALMVCALVWVMRSLLLVPVSALSTAPLTLSVGASVSTLRLKLAVAALVLPASSVSLTLKA